VDALVALSVLAAALVFCLAALHTAQLATEAALEARQAVQLLRERLDNSPATPGSTSGRNRRFDWVVNVDDPVLAAGAAALCRREAVVTDLSTRRQYRLASARICPSGQAP